MVDVAGADRPRRGQGTVPAVAPLWAADEITGASLVPVTVMVTSWVVVAPDRRGHGDREGPGKAVIGRQALAVGHGVEPGAAAGV